MNTEQLTKIFKERALLQQTLRSFFATRSYLEVETPILVVSPDSSPTLTPFETIIKSAEGTQIPGALITSPEFSMKKLLGEGLERIFTLTKVFRNSDLYLNGGSQIHNPEFTMLEWYQQGMDYQGGMQETEDLLQFCAKAFPNQSQLTFPFARIHLPTEFQERFGINLSEATRQDLAVACERQKIHTDPSDNWSDLFHRLMLTQIEPSLPPGGAFVYDFPKQQAALARLTPDQRYAERFELYVQGVELCNAFGELTDSALQRNRFIQEQQERSQMAKTVFPIDEELLRLLPSLHQPTFGNALGIDRLLMILTGATSIEEILAFPTRKLIN